MDYFVEASIASKVLGVGYEGIVKAVKRSSDAYSHTYIEAKGRGGKKLLIGVTKAQLEKADLDPETLIWNDLLEPTTFEVFNSTIISDSKKENTAPDMRDFLNASDTQQRQTLLKLNVIEGYAHRKGSTSEYIASLGPKFDELSITEGKLFRWLKSYADAKEAGISPLVALLDKRGAKKGTTQLTQEQQEMAVRMLCRRDNPLSVTAIHRNMAHRYGRDMPSYAVLNNYLEQWKQRNPMVYAMAQDADGFKNKRMAAFGSLSEKALYPNHYWELDSTPADVITSDGKRWTVLCAIDVFSRRAVFWLDERSSSYSIARLLRKAIMKMGIPENVVIDNGKDYKSNHFESICYNLGIHQEVVPPFSGDMKPHVERIFRTLSTELFEEMQGYIGHSVSERQRIQSRRGFQHKIESQDKWHREMQSAKKQQFVDAFKLKASNAGLELQMNIEHSRLEYWIDGWANLYENRKHGSLQCSPMQKWHETAMPIKSIPDPRMLDVLLSESFTRRVGKQGIRLQGALYMHVNLAAYIGEHVQLMCPDDRGYVFVYTMDHKPICIAEDPEHLGKSRAEYAEGKRLSKRIMREINSLLNEWEAYSADHDPSIQDRIEAAAERIGLEPQPSVTAVTKPTETIMNVIEASRTFAEQDSAAAEASNVMDMKGEKMLPSGRPPFKTFYDRFLWDLTHDRVDESTMKAANKHPEMWQKAKDEHERKIG